MPLRDLSQVVSAHHKKEVVSVIIGISQVAQRVDGVGTGRSVDVYRADCEPRLVTDRGRYHCTAVVRAAQMVRIAVGRLPRGHEQDEIEVELAQGFSRHQEVHMMDRVKGTAENPDAGAAHPLRPFRPVRRRYAVGAVRVSARQRFRLLRRLAARLLLRFGVTPNQVTVTGTIGLIVAAVAFAARGRFLEATIIGVPSAYLDLVDGAMARLARCETRFGAVLDAVCDRIADGALFGSIAYWLLATGQRWAGVAALVCLVMSGTVSFARAKAEGVGLGGETGIAHRFTRLKLAGVAGVLGALGVPYGIAAMLWLIAGLSALTVYQRLRFAYVQAEQGLAAQGQR